MRSRVNQDLFKQAKQNMSKEEIAKYEEIGEKMYNSVDFENSKVLTPTQDIDAESIAYITEAVKSGLHPDHLSENEQFIMESHYGADWKKRFHYE